MTHNDVIPTCSQLPWSLSTSQVHKPISINKVVVAIDMIRYTSSSAFRAVHSRVHVQARSLHKAPYAGRPTAISYTPLQRIRRLTTTSAIKSAAMLQPRAATHIEEQTDGEDSEPVEPYEDFGTYSILLPPEPFVFGTEHLKPYRNVPGQIPRPPYALREDGMPEPTESGRLGNASGKIKLGGATERKVREAAALARRVREFAGTQVKVSSWSLDTRAGGVVVIVC